MRLDALQKKKKNVVWTLNMVVLEIENIIMIKLRPQPKTLKFWESFLLDIVPESLIPMATNCLNLFVFCWMLGYVVFLLDAWICCLFIHSFMRERVLNITYDPV